MGLMLSRKFRRQKQEDFEIEQEAVASRRRNDRMREHADICQASEAQLLTELNEVNTSSPPVISRTTDTIVSVDLEGGKELANDVRIPKETVPCPEPNNSLVETIETDSIFDFSSSDPEESSSTSTPPPPSTSIPPTP
jgi:hypothetical protein